MRQEAALDSGCPAADTSISLARWKQGEQAMAGPAVVFLYTKKLHKQSSLHDGDCSYFMCTI